MKKFLLLIILSFSLCCCKTTKYNMRETTKSDIKVIHDVKEEVKILEETKVSDNISQLVDELTTIIERIITVKLSAPDSLYHQHPVEITTTEREYSKGKTVKYEANSQTEQKVEGSMQKTDNLTQNIQKKSEIIDKTTVKMKTPAWVFVSVAIFAVGVLLFVFLILRKYKIL